MSLGIGFCVFLFLFSFAAMLPVAISHSFIWHSRRAIMLTISYHSGKKKTTVFDRSSVLFTKRTHIHFHTHAYCDARRVKRLYRDKNISWKNLLLLFSFFLSKWIRIACFCRSETGRVDFVQMWWILNGNYGPVLGHLCNVSLFFVNKICSKFLGINVITSTSGFWFYYLMRHSI